MFGVTQLLLVTTTLLFCFVLRLQHHSMLRCPDARYLVRELGDCEARSRQEHGAYWEPGFRDLLLDAAPRRLGRASGLSVHRAPGDAASC